MDQQSQPQNEYDELDSSVIIDANLMKTDIKINPDFYIHLALIKAQTALQQPNANEGFLQYYVIVEHMEVLAKAAKQLDDNYDDIITTYKTTDEGYLNEKNPTLKMVRLANCKLYNMMQSIFSQKTLTKPIRA